MLSYKELAETVLSDLMNNRPVSDALLKMKILASVRNDYELLSWVTKELNGYAEETPPKYRILNSGVKIKVFVPFRGEFWIEFHAEMVEDERVRERLVHIPFHQSIGEIESLCNASDDEGTINMHVPVFAYSFMSKFINGDIQDAYQYSTKAAVTQIVISVKAILIDFLLKVNNEEDIDFNTFIKTIPQMSNVTINAGVVNTGNGIVNAQGSTNVVGDNNCVNSSDKAELLRILSEIDKIAASFAPNSEYEDVSKDMRMELQKDAPAKNFLKRCFQAIPSILTGVSTGVVANGLSPLITTALSLL